MERKVDYSTIFRIANRLDSVLVNCHVVVEYTNPCVSILLPYIAPPNELTLKIPDKI